jgi:hypothetical protein
MPALKHAQQCSAACVCPRRPPPSDVPWRRGPLCRTCAPLLLAPGPCVLRPASPLSPLPGRPAPGRCGAAAGRPGAPGRSRAAARGGTAGGEGRAGADAGRGGVGVCDAQPAVGRRRRPMPRGGASGEGRQAWAHAKQSREPRSAARQLRPWPTKRRAAATRVRPSRKTDRPTPFSRRALRGALKPWGPPKECLTSCVPRGSKRCRSSTGRAGARGPALRGTRPRPAVSITSSAWPRRQRAEGRKGACHGTQARCVPRGAGAAWDCGCIARWRPRSASGGQEQSGRAVAAHLPPLAVLAVHAALVSGLLDNGLGRSGRGRRAGAVAAARGWGAVGRCEPSRHRLPSHLHPEWAPDCAGLKHVRLTCVRRMRC